MKKRTKAPCKDCEYRHNACHDHCYLYKEFCDTTQKLKELKEADKALRDGKTRFWRDARNNGVKIGNHKGEDPWMGA